MLQDGSVQAQNAAVQFARAADAHGAAHVGFPRELPGNCELLAETVNGGEHSVRAARANQVEFTLGQADRQLVSRESGGARAAILGAGDDIY